jgi:hypothetical protein
MGLGDYAWHELGVVAYMDEGLASSRPLRHIPVSVT